MADLLPFRDFNPTKTPYNDYPYRAVVPREVVSDFLCRYVDGLNYDNYKDSIVDPDLHSAAEIVWSTMINMYQKVPSLFKRTREL